MPDHACDRGAVRLDPDASRSQAYQADEDVRSRGSGFWLAGRFGRSPAGPDAHSFDHRGRKEDQRGCYGTQAHRYERDARSGSGIRSGEWWRRIETERFRHVMPPENLKVDGVPAEYPDDAADPPQPSHPLTPVAAGAAWIWSITDAGCRPAHRPCRMIAADCRVKTGKMSVLVNPDPETRWGLRLGRRAGPIRASRDGRIVELGLHCRVNHAFGKRGAHHNRGEHPATDLNTPPMRQMSTTPNWCRRSSASGKYLA